MTNGSVQLMIIADTADESNALKDTKRILVLQRPMKEVSLDTSWHACTWKLSGRDFPSVKEVGTDSKPS